MAFTILGQARSKALKEWKQNASDFQKIKNKSNDQTKTSHSMSSSDQSKLFEEQGRQLVQTRLAVLVNENEQHEATRPSKPQIIFSSSPKNMIIKKVILKGPKRKDTTNEETEQTIKDGTSQNSVLTVPIAPNNLMTTVTTTTTTTTTTQAKKTRIDIDEAMKQSTMILDETSNSSTTTTIVENLHTPSILKRPSGCPVCEDMNGWWCIKPQCDLMFYLNKLKIAYMFEEWQINKIAFAISYAEKSSKESEHKLVPCFICNNYAQKAFALLASDNECKNIHKSTQNNVDNEFWTHLLMKNFLCTSFSQLEQNLQQNW